VPQHAHKLRDLPLAVGWHVTHIRVLVATGGVHAIFCGKVDRADSPDFGLGLCRPLGELRVVT
jgi:hypothetical protein